MLALGLAPRPLAPPADGWQQGAREPLVVTFNVPVSLADAEAAFGLLPPVAGSLSVHQRRLIFTPDEPFAYDRQYTLTLKAGLRGRNRLPMLLSVSRSFTIRQPQLLYLKARDGVVNLWLHQPDESGEGDLPLSDEPLGIWDYDPHWSGTEVLAAVLATDGSDDLVSYRLTGERQVLLSCERVRCRGGRWQPGGTLVAYERSVLESNNASEIWLLDSTSGQSWPVEDPELRAALGLESSDGRSPEWSADGRYLAYFKPSASLVVVWDMIMGEEMLIPANLEVMGPWSPVENRLAYTELAFGETDPHTHIDEVGTVISHTRPSLYSHLVLTDLASGESIDLSAGAEHSDGRPAWHPDGRLLALPRTAAGPARQLWLIPVDGRAALPLTDDPLQHHGALSWSPDGLYLAFMRVDVTSPQAVPTIWLYDYDREMVSLEVEAAFWPAWLP